MATRNVDNHVIADLSPQGVHKLGNKNYDTTEVDPSVLMAHVAILAANTF